MSLKLVNVTSKRQLRKFIYYPETLYKGCQNWVPPLFGDEFDTLDPKKNAAFEFCEAAYFLVYRDNEIVGRVAAIINHKANELYKVNVVRFGWIDFIDDFNVVKKLLDHVAIWGRERGCTQMKGPLGFTDLDKEGSLVEGYENFSPFTCLYNYPYYDKLFAQYGLEKDVDWTQKVMYIDPSKTPLPYTFASKIEQRYGLHTVTAKNAKRLGEKYGMSIFHMYNTTFAPLFEFTPLTDTQIKRYLKTYLAIMIPDFIGVVCNEKDEPVGFAFCVPSLNHAVKKCRGRLFPFGMFRVLKALKKNDTLEALMIGVLPEYQGKGAAVLLFKYLHENCLKHGITKMILNPQLEENYKVQSLYGEYRTEPFMRRRSYTKDI